jgi:hypothetical protein
MAFTKPFTYVDGAVLSATNHASNEDALREYVNQEIIAADVSVDTVVGESIATPRFITAVQTGDFVTKTLQGVSKLRLPQAYSWFTSTTKSDNQTSTTVEDYQYEKSGLTTRYSGTRAYVWENFSGFVGSVFVDPGFQGNGCGHRSIMMTRMLTLDAGRYKFSVAVNAKVEKGQINCQSFTIETFHV